MIRIGIAGLGFLGQAHFQHCQAFGRESGLAQVTAVADADADRLAGHAPVTGNVEVGPPVLDLTGIQRFADAAEMIEQAELDAVFICLPTGMHAQAAVQAAERGLHVFCEKPMALRLAEADAMIAAAQRGGVRLVVGHVLRFWPEFELLKGAVQSGRLGALRSLAFNRLCSVPRWSWRNWMQDEKQSGGGLLDIHIHDVDAIQWVLGRPRAISAVGWNTGSSAGGIDWVEARYDYGPELSVRASGGWLNFPSYDGFEFAYEALFERGWIRCNGAARPTTVEYDAEADEAIHPQLAGDAYANEDRFFIECLAEGRDPATVISPEEARTTLEMGLAEQEAILSGRGTVDFG